ncbi:SIR2 family protein [Confluentibacter sediminis]|uniref:SIR2 family protein n=1 Tax=Confluentibacter sediminis TaxID=2219045 RepID=UPI000DAE0099|nr:SIR2 family protein [Confluentibacter sediminis]
MFCIPYLMVKNKFNNNIASLKEAINNDRLVIFAGAGISKDSGIPLWTELESGIKSRLNDPTRETDALKIAQMLYNEKGEKEYNEIIKELLFRNNSSYNSLHETITELNPQHIITTNYDRHFEGVISDRGLPFSIVSKDEDLPYAKHKKLLIKYHGDFENHNIVLKENDYLEFSQNHTLKEVFVKSLFSNKTILFLGYSVSDPNLKLLIREIQYLLKKHYQRAYLLTTKVEVSDSEVKYFESLGINILFKDSDETEISEIENVNLSDIGKKVYSQLKYIKNFKLYEYRNLLDDNSDKSKIINELYNSLSRFHYTRVLPQITLASLYPLSKDAKEEPAYLVRGTTLKCFNQSLYELISNYEGQEDKNFTSEEKDKLNYCLGRIVMSGIYSLGKIENPDSWGSYRAKEELELIPKIKYNDTCDCIDCTLNNYDYAGAVNKIFKYHINDNTELWNDLIYTYSLYRIRDYYNCFLALKDIIVKANRLNKLEVSFLAKYNLKRLKWAVSNEFMNDRISWNDVQEIKTEIDSINLDEELDKVKYFVDKDVFDFLKEVRDGVYIQRLCNEIDEIFVKVPRTVESIKNGGSHSSNVFNNLYEAVRKLKAFLDTNFLIGNGFSPIEDTLKKSINTFILGYYLKNFAGIKKHSFFGLSHIIEFDTFMFNLIIDNSDNKELIRILEKNEIHDIKIGKESLGKIFTYINNFLKSSYKIPRHFGNDPVINKSFISAVAQNEIFNRHLMEKFSSICLVIAYFDFSKPQLKTIYSNINHYINFMKFSDENLECLNRIYEKKGKLLDDDDLLKTLKIFDKNKKIDSTYLSIVECLKEKNKKFKHEDIDLKSFDLNRNTLDFPILYHALDSDNKKAFKKNLEAKLGKVNDGQMFYITISEKILLTKKIKNQYKNIINGNLKVKLDETTIDTDYVRFRVKQFFDLVNKGIIDDQGINTNEIEEDQFKFLLNPENFEPSMFKVDWLKYYNWDSYCKRFSEIDYIKTALKDSLKKRFDEKLSETYFKIEKWHQ